LEVVETVEEWYKEDNEAGKRFYQGIGYSQALCGSCWVVCVHFILENGHPTWPQFFMRITRTCLLNEAEFRCVTGNQSGVGVKKRSKRLWGISKKGYWALKFMHCWTLLLHPKEAPPDKPRIGFKNNLGASTLEALKWTSWIQLKMTSDTM